MTIDDHEGGRVGALRVSDIIGLLQGCDCDADAVGVSVLDDGAVRVDRYLREERSR